MLTWTPCPSSGPGALRDRFLLAYIAYNSDVQGLERGKADCEVSILFLQQQFRLASESAAEKVLTRLRSPSKGGPAWIEKTRRTRGNHYRIGPAAALHRDTWSHVGQALFGPGGLLVPYLARPILSGAGLGPDGCLVLAFIERLGPVTEAEVVANLQGFMSRRTVLKRINHVLQFELIRRSGGTIHAPNDLRDRVRRFEIDSNAAERTNRVDRTITHRWISYQTKRLGDPEIAIVKASLRKRPCFYCIRPAPAEGNHVEHMPPAHWGGTDQLSLLLPICRECNQRHGALLGRTPAVPSPPMRESPLKIVWPGDDTRAAAPFFLRVMVMSAVNYALAMDEQRISDARSAALDHFEIWCAFKTDMVDVIAAPTGEVASSRVGAGNELIDVELNQLGGTVRLARGERLDDALHKRRRRH